MAGTFLYAGCYTHDSPVGIRVYEAVGPDGLLEERSQIEGVEHPSFLAAHPSGRVLYAVSETASFDGSEGGGLVSFAIEPADGTLTPLDRMSSPGAGPCHVSVDAAGRHVYVANYLSGSIAVYSLAADGRVGSLVAHRRHRGSGPSPRQDGPHAHCVLPGPDGVSVHVVDLGLDCVVRYEHAGAHHHDDNGFHARERLALDPGSGPRHLTFHPGGRIAFLVCELQSTIEVLASDVATGQLTALSSCSTLPEGFRGDSLAAEVRVHPSGHRVYVSNRGDDSIAVFAFTASDNRLEHLAHCESGGKTPRSFAVHPSGRSLVVANQDSNSIVPFGLDACTAVPERLGVSHDASEPVCLTFVDVAS